MANYWIKMYMEILDDPKMATLPDRLWRRTIELFLVAGRTNQGGEIPDTAQIAWMLRMSTDDLSMDLRQIESVGIITRTQTGWMVNNFAKRQAAIGGAERVKAYREREQHAQYTGNENVTKRYTDTDKDTESDKEPDKDKDAESDNGAAAFSLNELNTAFIKAARLNPFQLDKWSKALEELERMGATPDDITLAVESTIKNYPISGPWSILKSTAIAMSKRRQVDNHKSEKAGYAL